MARLNDWRWSPRPALVRSVCLAQHQSALLRLCKILQTEFFNRRTLFALLLCTLIAGSANAQTTDVNDIHVVPRETSKPVPKQELVTPGFTTHVRPMKVDVDLVLVPVTITDPMNRSAATEQTLTVNGRLTPAA